MEEEKVEQRNGEKYGEGRESGEEEERYTQKAVQRQNKQTESSVGR